MSFETVSLLLNWMEMGALLAILFRLSGTFNLIANTQRELRRAIYHLGERRGAELGTDNAFDRPGIASVSRSRLAPANTESIMGPDDLASLANRGRRVGRAAARARWRRFSDCLARFGGDQHIGRFNADADNPSQLPNH